MCNMNTKSLRVASAAVIGARHARDARNGQDAAASWVAGEPIGPWPDAAVVVVCDGCGSGASSEVGARLGARAVLGAITARLKMGAHLISLDAAFWAAVRADIVAFLGDLAKRMPGALEDVVHDYLLFTIVAAVVIDETAYIWAIGDGAYVIDGIVRELGPFANNQPPYIAYDLIGTPAVAHEETAPVRRSVIVATDGAAEMRCYGLGSKDGELELVWISTDPASLVTNPDALRRFLAKRAKAEERIDWDARRVIRTHAALQDDGAIAIIVRDEKVLS